MQIPYIETPSFSAPVTSRRPTGYLVYTRLVKVSSSITSAGAIYSVAIGLKVILY